LVCRPAFCRSSVHLPVPLGSTVITRFAATTGTLTPARLFPALGRSPWLSSVHFQTFRLQPPHAPPSPGNAPCSGRAWPPIRFDSLSAVLRTSLFARSLVSRIKPYRVCVAGRLGPSVLRTILSFPVALHTASPRCSYFQLVAGSTATEGLPPSHARSFPSARAPTCSRLSPASRPQSRLQVGAPACQHFVRSMIYPG